MKRLGGLLAILCLTASVVTGSAAGPRSSSAEDPIRVSAKNGDIRCTAVFPRRTIPPGRLTEVRLKLTNLGEDEYFWHNPKARLAFRDSDGDRLWRTNVPNLQPNPPPITIAPGDTVPWYISDTRVRWTGPLKVRPICLGLGKRMPAVELHVGAPGPPLTTDDSIDAAVAYPGNPFQACAPGPQGQARTGSLESLPEDGFPPLTVRCWADVRTEAGFDVVGLNMVSPDDAPDYTIREGTGPRPGEEVKLPGTGSLLAARWAFVVTEQYVRPVFSKTFVRTAGDGDTAIYVYRRNELEKSGTVGCSDNGEPIMRRNFDARARDLVIWWINTCSE